MNTAALLAATARSFGQARAVSLGERPIWNYAQLHERVARLAGGLRRHPSVQAGDRIALVMKNCPAYFELMWAGWHAGLCIVPVNAKLHPREIAFILEHCGVKLCFVSPDSGIDQVSMGSQPSALARIISITMTNTGPCSATIHCRCSRSMRPSRPGFSTPAARPAGPRARR